MCNLKKFTKEEIESFMPQQHPYLFVEEAEIEGGEVRGSYTIKGDANKERRFFTSADGVRCMRICKPGDRLEMKVSAKRIRHPIGIFEGSIFVNGEKAAYAEKISLTFDF